MMRRLVLVAVLAALAAPVQAQSDLNSFAVREGYALSVDSHGFVLPTSIAFVPSPGDAADDPLYFVAELRGSIKVVTRDRQVRQFAEVPAGRGQDAELYGESQGGLGGLCLDPRNGYVFATFTARDEGGVLRNRMVRFTTRPGSFGLAPTEMYPLDQMLRPFRSAPAHQIGNCVVEEGRVFVGIGDGGNPSNARKPEVLTGKILCLDPDGNPCPDNPAMRDAAAPATDAGEDAPEAFVHARGVRNPFGLARVEGALYAVDNGIDIDRLLRIEAGGDYLWSGTDQSLAVMAQLVFTPAASPVQLAHVAPGSSFVDEELHDHFLAATFGGNHTSPGIIEFARTTPGRPASLPQHLLEYVGEPGRQRFAAVALGPDGIYTVPMVPGPDGLSSVLRLRHEPAAAHPVTIHERAGLRSMAGFEALTEHGCVSCHAIAGRGGGIGPTLDYFGMEWRLTRRLNSPEYRAQVAAVDASRAEPFARWRAARQDVMAATGVERTWRWLAYFLQEPRFDDPEALMPNLGLSESQARRLRAELFEVTNVGRQVERGWTRHLGRLQRNIKPLLAGMAAGASGVLLAGLVPFLLILRRRSARRPRQT